MEPELTAIFDKYDEDGNGALSIAEFTKFVNEALSNLSKDKVAALLAAIDGDSSGTVSLSELRLGEET